MTYAVIQTGGKQYLVTLGEELDVELLNPATAGEKSLEFEPLLVFNDKDIQVGQPVVTGVKITAEIVEPRVLGQKLRIIRYKAKKRVNKQTGHRQKYTRIKITAIGNEKAAKEAKKPVAKANSKPKTPAKKSTAKATTKA